MGRDRTTVDKKPDTPFPIVGIGASAGGLHSFECFLEALPKDLDFSIIFIRHPFTCAQEAIPQTSFGGSV